MPVKTYAKGGTQTKKNLHWSIDKKNGGALLVWGTEKPSKAIRENLGKIGFKWSPKNEFWWLASFKNTDLREVKEITGKQQQSIYYPKK